MTAQERFSRTKQGVVSIIYNSQKSTSKKRNHPPPTYTQEELKIWVFSQSKFHELYDNWVESGHDKWIKPSCDRTNDYLGYSLDRLQIMTWQENKDKFHTDQITGINNKRSKSVLQYDLNGNFIKEHYSTRRAGRELNIAQGHISTVCCGKRNTAGGFIWRHKQGGVYDLTFPGAESSQAHPTAPTQQTSDIVELVDSKQTDLFK